MIAFQEDVWRKKMQWYIAKCPTGAEENAIKALKELLIKAKLQDDFIEYFVPYDKTLREKNNAPSRSRKSNMANYIFIKMNLTSKMQELISKVDMMSLMLDEHLNPIVSNETEIEKMRTNINKSQEETDAVLHVGENVKVLEAPFEDFSATIEKVDSEKQMATVSVPILGRQISLELPFKSIKRIKD